MEQSRILLGVAPTRRNLFSREKAILNKEEIYRKLINLGVQFVDIEDICEDGLLYGTGAASRVIEKFKNAKVDAVFFPHVNFGTEDLVGKVAVKLNVPVLLWGPRDNAPLPDGTRETDSQCGLFATGKVLRRFGIPFNYLTNCSVDDELFERGVDNFLKVTNVVKEFRNLRILQISTRPSDFWTMMYNEGELLERFGTEVFPVAMPVLTGLVKSLEQTPSEEVNKTIKYIDQNMEVCIDATAVKTVAALKCAIKQLAEQND